MTFGEIPVGTKFKDIYANLEYVKVEPLKHHGKRLSCHYCDMASAELLNARAQDGVYVHFCPSEEVSVMAEVA